MSRRCTDHVVLARFGSESDQSNDLEQNHQHLDNDRTEAGTNMGKVRKLVVIYIRLDPCSTAQVHCIRHVHALATWSLADLGSESDESDDLEQNHQHLDSDRERAGTKMGKMRKLVMIYICSNPRSTTQVHCVCHVAVLTTWS